MSRRADERMGGRESSEDYLEAILVIRRLRGSCRNVDIAERMGVAKPSVTKALGNLARRGLAEVVGRDVRLTEEGGRLAEATLDKHRFFERLLVESGVDAETASAEACRMEHCLSEDSDRRFAAYLGADETRAMAGKRRGGLQARLGDWLSFGYRLLGSSSLSGDDIERRRWQRASRHRRQAPRRRGAASAAPEGADAWQSNQQDARTSRSPCRYRTRTRWRR